MKKLLCLLLTAALLLSLTVPALAATPSKEILVDPNFEEMDDDAWIRYVESVIDFTDENPQEGKSCLIVTDRTHSTDVARQYVTDQMNYYGPGKYKISGYVRLANPEQGPIEVQMVLGYYTDANKKWATSSYKKVTAEKWVSFTMTVTCQWTGELNNAELYFITNETETAQGEFADILIDSCSMVKADFQGTDFWDLTPEPTKEPTAAPTAAPTTVPTAEAEVTDAPTEEPEKQPMSSNKILGIALIAVGAVLLGTGVALIISAKKGKKDEQ